MKISHTLLAAGMLLSCSASIACDTHAKMFMLFSSPNARFVSSPSRESLFSQLAQNIRSGEDPMPYIMATATGQKVCNFLPANPLNKYPSGVGVIVANGKATTISMTREEIDSMPKHAWRVRIPQVPVEVTYPSPLQPGGKH